MTSPLFPDSVGVANVLPLFECPDWLHVRLSPELSRDGRELCEVFLRTVALVLRRKPPRRALISCDCICGALSILFDAMPARSELERSVLAQIAEALQELHNRRFAAQVREQAPPPAVEVPDFDLPAVEHDFDLVGLVTGRRLRESVDIFRFAENAQQLEQRIKGRDGEAGRRVAQTLERLALTGLSRPVASPPADWERRLDLFEENFPNFQEAIHTAIRPHVSLSAMGLSHRLAPILLVGPPGIGKTRFANALADVLGAPSPLFLAMAAETNSSTLAGSSTFWSNSSPGQLFESIAWGRAGHAPVANGLVILDEIDKANTTGYSALGPLYSLLEEQTARHFADQSLPDLVFDASHLRLVATANELSEVPAPLQSRMLVFEISPPSPSQLIGIARQILGEMICKLSLPFSAELPPVLEPRIAVMSPRSIKLGLEIAFARAVVARRDHIAAEDWPDLRMEGHTSYRHGTMGFMSN